HVHRPALAGTVQVHHVQEARPGLHERTGSVQRVVHVDRLLGEVAALEANRLAAADVDRREEDHAARLSPPTPQIAAKLPSSCKPCGPDFSGWNCTPYTGSRSTAVTNSPP